MFSMLADSIRSEPLCAIPRKDEFLWRYNNVAIVGIASHEALVRIQVVTSDIVIWLHINNYGRERHRLNLKVENPNDASLSQST